MSANTKGMARFCRPLDLTKSYEILRFEENHGPDPPWLPAELSFHVQEGTDGRWTTAFGWDDGRSRISIRP
jgi:hypothetical protein